MEYKNIDYNELYIGRHFNVHNSLIGIRFIGLNKNKCKLINSLEIVSVKIIMIIIIMM